MCDVGEESVPGVREADRSLCHSTYYSRMEHTLLPEHPSTGANK